MEKLQQKSFFPQYKDSYVFTRTTRCKWALNKAQQLNIKVLDNSAKKVACYCPEYTLIEKLQTISTKYRLQQASETMPINFLRHYYDVYQLLQSERVTSFIGTDEYHRHKDKRFRNEDEKDITKNEAFLLGNKTTRDLYTQSYKEKSSIYFGEQPSFGAILNKIAEYAKVL
tara:strand:- start:20592 stop:21104 length:513 start_codon:yes stop_codon:yes gene_type:complete